MEPGSRSGAGQHTVDSTSECSGLHWQVKAPSPETATQARTQFDGRRHNTATPPRPTDAWIGPLSGPPGPRLVHTPSEPSVSQRSPAVSSSRSFAQVAGAILRKQARGRNPDKDEVPGSSPGRPTIPFLTCDNGRRVVSFDRGWCRPSPAHTGFRTHPCTAVLRRFRVERRTGGSRSSVMASTDCGGGLSAESVTLQRVGVATVWSFR
jgi:hypothetical protein